MIGIDPIIGPWLVGAASVLALARVCVVVIALRGTTPRDRPAILRALPGLISIRRGNAGSQMLEESDLPQSAGDP
jgi:hypothetical protein